MHRMPTIADFLTHFKPTEADKRADILSTRSSSAYKHERKIMMTDEWKFIYALFLRAASFSLPVSLVSCAKDVFLV